MPLFFLLLFLTQLACAFHATHSGRPQYWFYIIMFLPGPGVLAYLLFELLPEYFSAGGHRRSCAKVGRLVDRETDLREAARRAQVTGSVADISALGEECLRLGRHDMAIELLQGALTGPHETDPAIMLSLARAHFGKGDHAGAQGVLDALRTANPDYRSPEGHLLYARSLAGQGKVDAALFEYDALARYYPGQEARARYALLLHESGAADRARDQFEEIRQAVELAPRHARRSQKEWYDLALRHLSA